jgi:hypothetical protein
MDINQLVEFILKDDKISSRENFQAAKKKKGKNKKKAKKTDAKNVQILSLNTEGNCVDENEVFEFRNKLRDSSINANNV